MIYVTEGHARNTTSRTQCQDIVSELHISLLMLQISIRPIEILYNLVYKISTISCLSKKTNRIEPIANYPIGIEV